MSAMVGNLDGLQTVEAKRNKQKNRNIYNKFNFKSLQLKMAATINQF